MTRGARSRTIRATMNVDRNERSPSLPPTALVLLGIVSVQIGSALAKHLFATVGSLGTVALRMTFAAGVLVLWWRPSLRLGRSAWTAVLVYGVVLGAMNLCFYLSLARIPLGIAVTIEFLGPLTVALLGSRRWPDVFWALLAAGGVVLLMEGRGELDLIGVLFGLAAGTCWSLYILASAALGRHTTGGKGLAFGMAVAALVAAPFGVVASGAALIQPRVLIVGLGVALLSSVVPYSLELEALRKMPPRVFGILMSLEPAMAALIGLILLKEWLHASQWLAVLCVVIASAGATRGARRDSKTAVPIATIPIDISSNYIRLPLSIQGSPPFHLILDTGMPTRGVLLCPTPRVDSLGLAFQGGRAIRGAGGTGAQLSARTARAEQISVGGHSIADVPVIVLPHNPGFPEDVDGVVGAELFERFAVRVDADRRRVELFDTAWTPPAGSASIPIRVDRKVFVDARVAVEDGDPVPVDLAVDLGAGHSLWLNQRDERIRPPAHAIATTLGRGLSGDLHGQIGRVRRFELGPFAFEDVTAIFPDREQQNPGGADFRDGFVGAEILTRFRVTFDYAHQRMVLEPGARIAEPFDHDMSGLALDPQSRDRAAILVVVHGSPADEAGLRVGDVLVAIDGRALGSMSPDEVGRALMRDGAEVALGIERGAERIEKRLRLRRLV